MLKNLLKYPYKFNLFRMFQILENNNIDIKARTNSSMVFPASEIKKIKDNEGNLLIEISYSGIVGVDSPLPSYFLEYLNKSNEYSNIANDFLNIINARYYQMLYDVWKHYKVYNCSSYNKDYYRFLDNMSGLALSTINSSKLSRFALNFSSYNKTKDNLHRIILALVPDSMVNISDNFVCWIEVSHDKKYICTLSDNIVLGGRVYSSSDKVLINIIFSKYLEAISFYNNKNLISILYRTIKVYLEGVLSFQLKISYKILEGEIVGVGKNLALGYNSILGGSRQNYTLSC